MEMDDIIRQPRQDLAEWIAIRIKAFSHRSISKRYYSFKKFIGDNIREFYYPKVDIRGKEKIYPPFSTILFTKLMFADAFLIKWRTVEPNIIHYYRTNRNSVATVISDYEMKTFLDSLNNVVMYVDDDDFKIGDRVFYTKGAMEGKGIFEVTGFRKNKKGNMEYNLRAIISNNKRIIGSFQDGSFIAKGEELKRC